MPPSLATLTTKATAAAATTITIIQWILVALQAVVSVPLFLLNVYVCLAVTGAVFAGSAKAGEVVAVVGAVFCTYTQTVFIGVILFRIGQQVFTARRSTTASMLRFEATKCALATTAMVLVFVNPALGLLFGVVLGLPPVVLFFSPAAWIARQLHAREVKRGQRNRELGEEEGAVLLTGLPEYEDVLEEDFREQSGVGLGSSAGESVLYGPKTQGKTIDGMV